MNNSTNLDVVTFGETMILFSPVSSGPLRYVHSFNKSVGGAESNVAVALSRLGHKVGWFSKLGDDELGRNIQLIIRGEGVDVSQVSFDKERSTGLMIKEKFIGENPSVYYYRKNSAASALTVDDIDEDYIRQAKILHITGISLAISKTAREAVYKAIDIARRNNILISFDPNIRLKLWSEEEAREVILDIAKKVDVILPGDDEGRLLLGTDKAEEIADQFLKMGCKTVVVKLGKKGCYAATKEEQQFVRGYVVERPEDTAGAGDGFAAGFLSGLLRELPLKECAELANGVGAMATLVKGDMEGYPSYEQLLTFTGKKTKVDR